MGSSRFVTVDKTFYGAPEYVGEQSRAFSSTFAADNGKRGLDYNIRDVYEMNLISAGHLDRQIEGIRLQDWIEKNGAGLLRQMNAVTWRWHVPMDRVEDIRRPFIGAGITVVKK